MHNKKMKNYTQSPPYDNCLRLDSGFTNVGIHNLILVTQSNSQEKLTLDYNYGSEEIDECELNNCNLHNHVKESCDVCHHNKFPNETINEKFGDDVRTCCAGHGYIFKDHCEVTNFLLIIVFFFKDCDNPMTKKCWIEAIS